MNKRDPIINRMVAEYFDTVVAGKPGLSGEALLTQFGLSSSQREDLAEGVADVDILGRVAHRMRTERNGRA